MELLSVIRRWRHRDHFSIREISRRTGLSRNTVRKYLRADSVEPQFNAPERASKLDPYADKLSHMLALEAGKFRKQKRTIRQFQLRRTDDILGFSNLRFVRCSPQQPSPLPQSLVVCAFIVLASAPVCAV